MMDHHTNRYNVTVCYSCGSTWQAGTPSRCCCHALIGYRRICWVATVFAAVCLGIALLATLLT